MSASEILLQSACVLVVDDDDVMRAMLSKVLARDGYNIVQASNGAQAITEYTKNVPDVVLMDATMPEMDGFTACARLQELPRGATPVLMVTGLEDPTSVDKAFSAGATDYINKPLNWAVLRHRVRRIIKGSRAQKRIDFLAYHDALTGLPNRTLFLDRLAHALRQAQRAEHTVGVLFLDLDGFKLINDTLGHDVGDRLLQGMAERLQISIRECDTVARLGGDEFILLFERVGAEANVSDIAAKVIEVASQSFSLENQEVFVTTSIGIALYPDHGTDIRTLLKSADMAMYKAKEDGGHGHQFYTRDMSVKALNRLTLGNDLRKALERDELVVHYQPIISLGKDDDVCFEALVRWQHPSRGLVSPLDFIPVAEETGLIAGIGDWVLRTACNTLEKWRHKGHQSARLAVNLSGRQLAVPGLVANVDRILNETGFPAAQLDLELTETVVMERSEGQIDILAELRGLGIGLAIDDFGTGYSSLSHLRRLPASTVKIDRSFVSETPHDEDDSTIVKTIVAMAHTLKLNVTAEGVETAEQLRFLDSLGCDNAQGYHIARPMPASECLSWLDEHRSDRLKKAM